MPNNHRDSTVAALLQEWRGFQAAVNPLQTHQQIVKVVVMENTLSLIEIVKRVKKYSDSTRETGRRLDGYLRAVEKYRSEFDTTVHYESTRDFLHQCINLFAGYYDRLADVARELPQGIKQRHVYLLSRICESGKELFAESSKFKFESGRAKNKRVAVLVHRRISDAILSQLREYVHCINPDEPLDFDKPTDRDDLQNIVVYLRRHLAKISEPTQPLNPPPRKGDIRLLADKEWVNFKTAELFLGIGARQRQKLMYETGTLQYKGLRNNRKIAVKSIKDYYYGSSPNAK